MRTRTGNFSAEDEEIEKSYIVEYEGQYFAGWQGTDWATVPRTALWTKDRKQAEQIKINTGVERQDLMHLVTGFSNTNLLVVNLEDQKILTPTRKPKIWKSVKY